MQPLINNPYKSNIIKPTSLADSAYENLRVAIITGELESGFKLSEIELSQRFGISRSPIRIALTRLTSEGLIISELNKSSYVWAPTSEDIFEILSLRRNLEILASEIFISQINEHDLKALENIIKMQDKSIDSGDFLQLIQLDRNFHYYFIAKSKHSRLIKIWTMIMGQWEVLMHKRYYKDHKLTKTVSEDHNEILTTFRSKDLKKLISLHYEINQRVKEELVRFINP